ncbi:heavy metal-associated isoprenylated plant protein 16-like [Miscanthus floridulus]|uniref:heavy metal-associated isoprenylated plant protein 16-like n=1 Tax=Miscanthus floridulus TaxID=154761 RepID=UPI00345ADC87
MRKEIIIRIHVKSDKCQAKAMKVAAAGSGVESVTLAGGDKSLLLVIGDGVDSNKLLKKLKKKVGEAEIVELRTHDTFEAAALPLPGTKQELAAMAAAARSPYNNQHQQWQHSYAAAPTSPYSYHYYPSPVGGYGYGYGYGAGGAAVSSYSRAVARSHPANYSPMVERHDYQPMEHSSSSSSGKRRETMALPRHGSGTNSCTIL